MTDPLDWEDLLGTQVQRTRQHPPDPACWSLVRGSHRGYLGGTVRLWESSGTKAALRWQQAWGQPLSMGSGQGKVAIPPFPHHEQYREEDIPVLSPNLKRHLMPKCFMENHTLSLGKLGWVITLSMGCGMLDSFFYVSNSWLNLSYLFSILFISAFPPPDVLSHSLPHPTPLHSFFIPFRISLKFSRGCTWHPGVDV